MQHERASRGRAPARWLLVGLAFVGLILGGRPPAQAGRASGSEIVTATTFIALLARSDFAAAEHYFSPAVRADAPPATLRQIWQALTAQLGAFAREAGASEQPAGGLRNVVVRGVFARATAALVVTFLPDGMIGGFHVADIRPVAVPYTPPSYVHAASFRERAMTVGSAPWRLPGSLTMPHGRGPFPAVVLVAGSGPADRDETVAADRPFRDLAWGLASRGIATLRYDKRTLVYGAALAGSPSLTVRGEFVDDAVAAVRLLARTPGIDRRRIYVLGHSEGAIMAPRIAQLEPQVAGLILMAGPTRPLVDVLVGQYTYLQSRGLVSAAQVAAVRQQAAAIRALTPADRTRTEPLLGAPPAYWLSVQPYHPAAMAARLRIPLLILQGARDYQVTLADFAGWKAALATDPRATLVRYPDPFHPFIAVPPGSPPGLATPDAYTHPGHVDARVLRDIVGWLGRARV